MSEFAPGIAAARLALGDAVKIESHDHPAGATGVKFSLEQVALRARDGRNDPRVRAWAIRAIHDAGGPQDQKAQAVAILTALGEIHDLRTGPPQYGVYPGHYADSVPR